jgi:hypothetical protein
MPMQRITDSWNKDPEFSMLSDENKALILNRYFDTNYTDEDFWLLDTNDQIQIRNQFLKNEGIDYTLRVPELKPLRVPTDPPREIDEVKRDLDLAEEPAEEVDVEKPDEEVEELPTGDVKTRSIEEVKADLGLIDEEDVKSINTVKEGIKQSLIQGAESVGTTIKSAGESILAGPQSIKDLDMDDVAKVAQYTAELTRMGLPPEYAKQKAFDRRKKEIIESVKNTGEFLKEKGSIVEKYWGDAREKWVQIPKEIKDKRVWDNPELLASPVWWAFNIPSVATSLAMAAIPAAGSYKALSIFGAMKKMNPAQVARMAKFGAAVTGGTVGGELEATGTYQEVRKAGGSHEEARAASKLMFFFTTGLNSLSFNFMFSEVGKTFIKKAGKAGLGGVVEGLTEGAEEPAEVISIISAKIKAGEPVPDNVNELFLESFKNSLEVFGPSLVVGIAGVGGAQMRLSQEEQQNKYAKMLRDFFEKQYESPLETERDIQREKLRETFKGVDDKTLVELRENAEIPADIKGDIEAEISRREEELTGEQKAAEKPKKKKETIDLTKKGYEAVSELPIDRIKQMLPKLETLKQRYEEAGMQEDQRGVETAITKIQERLDAEEITSEVATPSKKEGVEGEVKEPVRVRDVEKKRVEAETEEAETVETLQEKLDKDLDISVRVDALGEEGTTVPVGQAQVTVTEPGIKPYTFSIETDNITENVQKAVDERETADKKYRRTPVPGELYHKEFAERNIPKLEKRIEQLQKSLWDTEEFVKSGLYDKTYPIPKKGGILAARDSREYKDNPEYAEQVELAINSVTENLIGANKARMILMGQPASGVFGVDYAIKKEKVKAGYGVDVNRAWNNEAKNKYPYTSYLGDVSIREGLQNSLDAVLESIENKEISEGKINIKIVRNFDEGKPMYMTEGEDLMGSGFMIEDNGVGMSDEDIRDKFLALHGTGKDKVGRFGGFGIAKAVILGPSKEGSDWKLETRDNYHDSDMAQNAEQVKTLDKPRQGTKIEVIARGDNRIITHKAKKYVETTEFPKNVTAKFNNEIIKNPFKGKKSKKFTYNIGPKGQEDKSKLTVSYYPKTPEGYNQLQVIRLVDKYTGAKLTQGLIDIYSDGFSGTIITDVETVETPGSHEYPLTDSRMELKYDANEPIKKLIEKYTIDKATAKRATIEARMVNVRDRSEWKKTLEKIITDKDYKNLEREVSSIYDKTNRFFGNVSIPYTSLLDLQIKIDVGYKGYKGGSMFQAKHLLAYEAVARMSSVAAKASVNEF